MSFSVLSAERQIVRAAETARGGRQRAQSSQSLPVLLMDSQASVLAFMSTKVLLESVSFNRKPIFVWRPGQTQNKSQHHVMQC